jgi:hypothetical protein
LVKCVEDIGEQYEYIDSIVEDLKVQIIKRAAGFYGEDIGLGVKNCGLEAEHRGVLCRRGEEHDGAAEFDSKF